MSTVVAQSLHVFGLRSHVANNIFFFDEQIIIFPSGNHCVKYNVDQKWQKFIPEKPRCHDSLCKNPATVWGAWVAQLVNCPTSAQVMISRFVSSSPASGSVLTAPSLEPASDSVSPSLSAPSLLTLCLSLSKINKD
uniref:Cilia and flagella associated protein 57 n=1 Tax=Felis catus TaxID=9685 RepID=A0ABI8AHX2_FELCA